MKEKTILCVDDDDIALHAMHTFVESAGNYRVKSVSSGSACLKFLRKNKADLIILDYKLTDSDGSDICKLVSAISLNPDIPIIIASALDKQKLEKMIVCKNVIKVVQKPYGQEMLQQDIADLLSD